MALDRLKVIDTMVYGLMHALGEEGRQIRSVLSKFEMPPTLDKKLLKGKDKILLKEINQLVYQTDIKTIVKRAIELTE